MADTFLDATAQAELVRTGEASALELVDDAIARVEKLDPELNAVIHPRFDRARDEARGTLPDGPFRGVPLMVKDLLAGIEGDPQHEGMKFLRDAGYRADHTDALAQRYLDAGFVCIGRTNTPELGIVPTTEPEAYGPTRNPWDTNRTTGGSSGGSAAAVASGMVPVASGSDVGGSIRVPAHFCGIVGLKPTAGRVPADGHTPAMTGLLSLGECVGPMARHVKDLDLLFSVISDAPQFENNDDASSSQLSVASLAGMRAAFLTGDNSVPVTEETMEAVEAAAKALSEAGLEVNEAKPPGISEGSRLWIDLFSRVAREQLQEFYRGRESEAGPLVSPALQGGAREENDLGMKIERAEALARALVERERLREEILRWMKTIPLIVMPVSSGPAFAHGATRVNIRGQSISIFRSCGHSHAANVFGLPSAGVPAGRSAEGLPIGVQIIGRPFEERIVLAAAAAIEEALGGWERPPQF